MTKTKTCSGCLLDKPTSDFYRARKEPDGYRYECKECVRGNTNNEAKRLYNKQWRLDHPERYMLNAARSRAKRVGIPFDLSIKDIHIPDTCPVLGIPLFHGVRNNPHSPTLDRVDNDIGYLKGNVVVVSQRANKLKSDATVAELKALASFYEAQAQKISSASL